jgi:hypothetical protein
MNCEDRLWVELAQRHVQWGPMVSLVSGSRLLLAHNFFWCRFPHKEKSVRDHSICICHCAFTSITIEQTGK